MVSIYNINNDIAGTAIVRMSITSEYFYTSLIVSLSASGCLLLNYALDFLSAEPYRSPSLHIVFGFVLVQMAYDACVLAVIIPSEDIQLLWSGMNARDYLLSYALITYVQMNGGVEWDRDGRLTSAALIFSSVGFISCCYSTSVFDATLVYCMSWVCLFCALFSFLILLYLTVRYCNQVRKQTASARQLCCVVYACVVTGALLAVILLYAALGPLAIMTISAEYLTCYVYLLQACVLVISLTSTRVPAYYHAQSVDLLKESRMYVRHNSHEIRTPLNILCMGLSLLHDNYIVSQQKSIDGLIAVINDPATSEQLPQHQSIMNTLTTMQHLMADLADTMQNAITSSDYSVHILNDLLTYEKVESGILELEKSIEDIKSIVDDNVVRTCQSRADAAGVTLQVVHPSLEDNSDVRDLAINDSSSNVGTRHHLKALVNVDKSKLSYALCNIVYHELKSAPRGSTIIIKSEWQRDQQHVEHDRDYGGSRVGIFLQIYTSQELTLVDALAREREELSGHVDRSRQQPQRSFLFEEGTPSLDLYVSRGIIEKHGGVLQTHVIDPRTEVVMTRILLPLVTQADGVTLPSSQPPSLRRAPAMESAHDSRRAPNDHHREESVRTEAITSPSASTGTPVVIPDWQLSGRLLRILMVDDSSMNRKMLERILVSNGFAEAKQVVMAENGLVALNVVKKSMLIDGQDVDADQPESKPFDLILMDNQMPVMGGEVASSLIRECGYTGLIIGLTGLVSEDEHRAFMRSGVDTVLTKPMTVENLRRELAAHDARLRVNNI
jgi:CheY-like chemotaxis protein